MSNETDLDWLARNVHVWPKNTPVIIQPGDAIFKFGEVFYEDCVAFSGDVDSEYRRVNKDQWLSRRAELQGKPSWDDHPYPVIHQYFDGWWRGNHDECASIDHWEDGFYWQNICQGEVLGSWRDTLERRPDRTMVEMEVEPAKAAFEPFTSIEDNQELPMSNKQETQQDDGWFERGELPPVGCVCQFFSAGYDGDWFDWCIFHGKASCGGFIVEHHHRTSPERVAVTLFYPALTKFRPIRTERDRLMDVIVSQGFLSKEGGVCGQIADAILAAGFKRDGGAK